MVVETVVSLVLARVMFEVIGAIFVVVVSIITLVFFDGIDVVDILDGVVGVVIVVISGIIEIVPACSAEYYKIHIKTKHRVSLK